MPICRHVEGWGQYPVRGKASQTINCRGEHAENAWWGSVSRRVRALWICSLFPTCILPERGTWDNRCNMYKHEHGEDNEVQTGHGFGQTLVVSSQAPEPVEPTETGGGQAWSPTLPAAAALLLHRRALHGTERAEYATVARPGSQQDLAVAALVKELAGIRGHGFLSGKTTVRTGQHGFQDDRIHRGLTSVGSRDSPHSWPPWSEPQAEPCRGHR